MTRPGSGFQNGPVALESCRVLVHAFFCAILCDEGSVPKSNVVHFCQARNGLKLIVKELKTFFVDRSRFQNILQMDQRHLESS